MSLNKILLSREQIQRLATHFVLDQSVERVTIEQSSDGGIGLYHRATFHTDKVERTYEADITDVGSW